ncbi:glycosyltransferase involved in cell wall biosynthesis [Desulfomicrobium macestii]|uniref:Glycosyltransferase involved in cell wall biosynthesis n=1 Tax=Desulfomicrobium macestii TaxID=90731 RepID=A0ABR9H4U6_9BACT|nr:glycosyltransferase family 4 protein [Desulfomicrobium macestii]MBE1425734.1 glycosyltransferase involved in cell wall biosynthesis [Desulfomicrobium macestii]
MNDQMAASDRAALGAAGVTHLDLGCEYRGGQRQVIYLAVEQHKAGMQVLVAAPQGSPILDAALESGLAIAPLPRRRDYHPLNLAALLGLLPASPHILHTHDSRAASLGALAHLCRRDLTLIHSRRVSYALGQGWSRWKYRLGALVACVSREVEDVVRRAGVSRTVVIPSAIVLDRYSRRKPGNRGRVGLIGALSPQKGHAQFFRALSLLAQVPEVWVIGEGALKADLVRQAESLGLSGRIVWKGHVESAQVLPSLDILVVPSAHGEGSSGVVKEGWASGVPVICSDLPANLELVRDEANGLVFANGDPSALARQIGRLLEDSALGEKLARAGNHDVAAYDASAMHTAYLRAYASVLSPLP